MSVEKAVGFEYNTLLECDGGYSGNVSIQAAPRTGSYCLRLYNGNQWQYQASFALTARDEYFIQFALQHSDIPNTSYQFMTWQKAGTVLGGLQYLNATQLIEVYTGNFTTLVGTTQTAWPTATWVIFQLHLKIADAGGIIKLRQGTNLEVDFSGDTKPGTDATIDLIKFGPQGVAYTYLDDLVVFNTLGSSNNSWPNGIGVYVIRPNAAGNYAQWSYSATGNYQCVDEIPPSMTDFVYTATNGQKDSYNLPACPIAAKEIAAVIADYWGNAAGSPPITQIKRLMRLSSTDYEGSGIALPPSFSKVSEVVELNPADSQAWEPADIDALELGMTSLT